MTGLSENEIEADTGVAVEAGVEVVTAEEWARLRRDVDRLQLEQFAIVAELGTTIATVSRASEAADTVETFFNELADADSLMPPVPGVVADLAETPTTSSVQADAVTQPAPRPGHQPVDQPVDRPVDRPMDEQRSPRPLVLPGMAQLCDWVDAHVAPLVRKTTTTGEGGGLRWCRRWWEHDDAVSRFTALFLIHRDLAADDAPAWRSVFLLQHLDPHLNVLTSPYGPFYACHPRRHSTTTEPLGHEPHETRPGVPTPGGADHAQHRPAVTPAHDRGPWQAPAEHEGAPS